MDGYEESTELINEFKRKFNQYTFDMATLYQIIYRELISFGDRGCLKTETFIDFENKKAFLPDDFRSLISGVMCKHNKSECLENDRDLFLAKVTTSRRTTAIPFLCNDLYECQQFYPLDVVNDQYNVIEEVWYDRALVGRIHYEVLEPVELTTFTKRSKSCAKDCQNLHYKGRYKVSIQGKTITAENFDRGHLQVIYNALPVDENGVPLIPILFSDKLNEYLSTKLFVEMAKYPDFMDTYKAYIPQWIQSETQRCLELRERVEIDFARDVISKDNIYNRVNKNRSSVSKHFRG